MALVCLAVLSSCQKAAGNVNDHTNGTASGKPSSGINLPAWAEKLNEMKLPDDMQGDSLIDVYFKYNQTVNGYEVTARWRAFNKTSETGMVIMRFHNLKTGKDYHYYDEKYSSNDLCKVTFADGFKGYENGDVYYFNYISPDTIDDFKAYNGHSPLGYYSPFQFLDIDFDGEEELLVSDWYQGQVGNYYAVYKLTDKGLQKQSYMPLDELTNMDRIDLAKKTITVVDFNGANNQATFYFSHKKRKDKITDIPTFYSSCAKLFDFKRYNHELGSPFVLDSIREDYRSDVEHHVSYQVCGGKILRK